jgi:hypothetical protein
MKAGQIFEVHLAKKWGNKLKSKKYRMQDNSQK